MAHAHRQRHVRYDVVLGAVQGQARWSCSSGLETSLGGGMVIIPMVIIRGPVEEARVGIIKGFSGGILMKMSCETCLLISV
ncbi:hypothetical protein L3X38_006499 [Prunus dulcis]|uniref:Uncharacterized protein n=1 Tax=Prunus dulcis TaxID=3755 RepID=A0AAD4ZSR6_PRUDU|nr:hypothetical protein L3X38_006499 [Prunus dulcis]